ncbi:MAG: tetratricopeptide repeat protein [Elusimicrobia bacterium]|nr:tetratricopeptide repeat protein [Elusimicrobiota bacterium]
MGPSSAPGRPYLIVLLLAALLYAAQLGRAYVGFLIDDAYYVMAARSLLQGRYTDLVRADTPPLIHFLPGLPLFLAPWVACVAPHWQLLQGLAVALLLAAAALLNRWLEGRLTGRQRFWAVLLFAFNPAVVRYCSLVTSEAWFLVLWLLILSRLDAVLGRQPRAGDPWLLALLLGWAALTRPEGIILTAAAAWLALSPQRRARLWPALAGAGAIWASWLLRNYWVSRNVSDYLGEWRADLRSGPIWSNWGAVLDCLFVQSAGLLAPQAGYGPWRALVLLGGLALALLGLREFLKRCPDPASRAAAAAWGLYLAVHLLWRPLDVRYFLPLLPLLSVFLVLGLTLLLGRAGGARWLGWSAAVLLAGTYAVQDARLLLDGVTTPPSGSGRNPTATWSRVKSLLPEDAPLLSNNGPTVCLYTGHQAYPLPVGIKDADEFLYLLAQKDIRHILLFEPITDVSPAHQRAWLRVRQWLRSEPRRLAPVFVQPEEGSSLYRVATSGAFARAYELTLGARRDFGLGAWPAGFAKLDEALALEPGLPSAVNDYAVAASLTGRNLPQAARRLEELLRRQPGAPQTRLNLARVYLKQGRPAEARRALRRP